MLRQCCIRHYNLESNLPTEILCVRCMCSVCTYAFVKWLVLTVFGHHCAIYTSKMRYVMIYNRYFFVCKSYIVNSRMINVLVLSLVCFSIYCMSAWLFFVWFEIRFLVCFVRSLKSNRWSHWWKLKTVLFPFLNSFIYTYTHQLRLNCMRLRIL